MGFRSVWKGDKVQVKANRAVANVLEEMGRRIAEDARQRAPVDTGNLRQSIKSSKAKERDGNVQVVIEADAQNARGERYAGYVELGTSRNRAQPFLMPAVRAAQRDYLPRLKKQLNRIK